MTNAEILSMQPGPELDIALGKALGAKVRRYRSKSSGNWLYELTMPGWCGSPDWFTMDGVWGAMPPLSSTWEGMRLVVEAMAAKGYEFELNGPDGSLSWFAWFRKLENQGEAPGNDAPHAVAIAARLALEGER